jgi:hypothetical protein
LHGFGIARRIEQVSRDVLTLNEGTVYTSLLRLQQQAPQASSHCCTMKSFVSEHIDGKPVYDMMIADLNPATTKLQFQVSTLQRGHDPVTYFEKYPDLSLSMHCQDWLKDSSTKSGFRQVPLGKGVVDWKAVFTAAKQVACRTTSLNLKRIHR